jgi:hypothetical protein
MPMDYKDKFENLILLRTKNNCGIFTDHLLAAASSAGWVGLTRE